VLSGYLILLLSIGSEYIFFKSQNQKTIVSKKNSGKKPKSKNHWFWLFKEPQRTDGYIGGY
jgi:hypothetical protein